MIRIALLVTVTLLFVGAPSSASAAPPGAVRGAFSIGSLASFDDKSKYIRGAAVWCGWRGDHVIVGVTLKNTSVESIEVTIKPRYFIARGGEHGSGFTSGVDFTLRGGETRAVVMDAGKPKNTPARAAIGRCAPYLWLID